METHTKIFQSSLYMTNSAVIETPDLILIVDPSWLPREIAAIRRYVDSLSGEKPRYLLLTHSDFDHVIGCGLFPDATVIGSKAMTDKTDTNKAEIIEQIRQFDDEYYIERDYPIEYPYLDLMIDEDGERLLVGSTTLTFYLSPGHTIDGILAVIEPGGILIAGDYLSDVEFPYIDHNSEAYLETLQKLETIIDKHPAEFLVPGHGASTDDREEMHRRVRESEQYIVELRRIVATSGNKPPVDSLVDVCRFPRNMQKYHEANIQLIERELGKEQG